MTTARHTARPVATSVCIAVASLICAACAPAPDPVASAMATQQPVNARVLAEDTWTFNGAEGRKILTDHFRLFTTATRPKLADRMPAFLEHGLAHYRTAIVDLPPPTTAKLDVYLMDNRPQWQRVTRRLMGDRADTIDRIQRGGFAARGVGVYYDIGQRDTLAIAAHEGWHQYTQRTFDESLPIWAEEGLATYMEGFRQRDGRAVFLPWSNLERYDQLRRAHTSGTLISLDELLAAAPEDYAGFDDERLLTYYAQVWALIHFLLEWQNGDYAGGLQQMLRDAAAGGLQARIAASFSEPEAASAVASGRGPAALTAYSGLSVDSLATEYRRFLDTLARPPVRNAVVAGRSPLEPGEGAVR
ncbi:MAG: DUF1570 domain-containing protein [Planctomycetota bacterium]